MSTVPHQVQNVPATSHRHAGAISSARLAVAATLIVALGFTVGLAEIWPLLHRQWTEIADYNHGYLMLAIAGWLTWRGWRADPPKQLGPDAGWLLPFACVLAMLLLMELVYLNVPRLYLLPLLLVTSVGFVFGREVAMRVLWPALMLYFALPIWPGLAGHLQAVTTAVNTFLLELVSIPVYIEGNYVYLPVGAFQIAEGCSGLNYLIVGMSLAALYGLAFLHTWRSRALLFAVGVAVTLVSNWLRVFIIIVAGYLTDMQHYLVKVDHITFGWVLFGIMLVPVLLCAGWLERRGQKPAAHGDTRRPLLPPTRLPVLGAAVVCGGLLLLPSAFSSVGAGTVPAFAALPAVGADGGRQRTPELAWQPYFEGGAIDRTAYDADGRVIEVYRALYPQQHRDARVIRFRHHFTGPDWRAVERRVREVRLDAGALPIIEFHGYAAGRETLIWAWYEVGGRPATSNLEVKLRELSALVRGRRDAAAIAIAAPCQPDCAATAMDLQAFLQANKEMFGLPSPAGASR